MPHLPTETDARRGVSSTIQFSLASTKFCSLAIFDALGREIVRPNPGNMESAGTHDVPFDARKLPPSVYAARLVAGGVVRVAKFVVQ